MTTVTLTKPTPAERLHELVKMHSSALLGNAVRLTCGDRHAAQDLTQETLMRAWRNIGRLTTDPADSLPWLVTIQRRLAIDLARARKARPVELPLAPDYEGDVVADPDDPIDRALTVQTVRGALAKLSGPHREVLIELYWRGHTDVEAAAVLHIPAGTVKSRAFYAIRHLRHVLNVEAHHA